MKLASKRAYYNTKSYREFQLDRRYSSEEHLDPNGDSSSSADLFAVPYK
jgi:hypothetical protein